jgi:hypothetical protein
VGNPENFCKSLILLTVFLLAHPLHIDCQGDGFGKQSNQVHVNAWRAAGKSRSTHFSRGN